jgi:hypothetical protein
MKINEEIGMVFRGFSSYILWLINMVSAVFVIVPFLVLYETYKVKPGFEEEDFYIVLIELPAIAALIIINKLKKNGKSH